LGILSNTSKAFSTQVRNGLSCGPPLHPVSNISEAAEHPKVAMKMSASAAMANGPNRWGANILWPMKIHAPKVLYLLKKTRNYGLRASKNNLRLTKFLANTIYLYDFKLIY
jgi:hypothetical protein